MLLAKSLVLRFVLFMDETVDHKFEWLCNALNDLEERWGDELYIDWTRTKGSYRG